MEKFVKISQNHFLMLIVIVLLLYHPKNTRKGKKICRQNLHEIFFLSSIQDLVKFYKNVFYPKEKNQLAQCGPEWVHSIFWGQSACHILELCEKINEISLKACLWQAVKKRSFFLGCRIILAGTVP